MGLDIKYKQTVSYMAGKGIAFIPEKPDHVNCKYRIMESGTSIFVKRDGYKINTCDEDYTRLTGELGLDSYINYSNKKNMTVDKVRPHSFEIDDSMFEKVVEVLLKNPRNYNPVPATAFENNEAIRKTVAETVKPKVKTEIKQESVQTKPVIERQIPVVLAHDADLKDELLAIKNYLKVNNIVDIDGNVTKVHMRENGKFFSFAEHIRGMVYSMLSAQTVWTNIERNMANIDALFNNFDPEFILSHDYTYFYDGLGRFGARGRLTNGQLKELHHNIGIMQSIIKQYGSMDAFVDSRPVYEIIDKLANPASRYKLKMMGEPLVCEYLRNVGVDCFKPDVHLKRLLGRDRLRACASSDPSFSDLYSIMIKLKKETGLKMAQIDYLLWAFCATGLGEVCTANPNCNVCPVRSKCHFASDGE